MRLAFTSVPTKDETTFYQTPNRIRIVSAQIEAPIVKGTVNKSTWTTSENAISHLATSALPGTQGNSVYYGHNWAGLFAHLKDVLPGDLVEIVDANATKNVYTIESIGVVSPDQTHILNETIDKRITLYTCTGFLDSKRLVVTGILKYSQTLSQHYKSP